MRTLLVVSILALTAGCKSKPKRSAPPANVGSAKAGSDNVARPAPDLVLPRSKEGGPPKKTTAPLTKADFERLDKLEFPGFMIEHRTLGDKVLEVRQKTKDHPRLWATVTIQPCFACVPMDLDKWKAKENDLKVEMGKLADVKPFEDDAKGTGLESELGKTELAGATVIYQYYVGIATVPGEGGGGTSFANAYIAYYNDGVNEIRVIAAYKDDPTTFKKLKELAPKDDLRALALSFLDVYTHEWAPSAPP